MTVFTVILFAMIYFIALSLDFFKFIITLAASHSRLTQKASMYHKGNRVLGWSVYEGGGGGGGAVVARQMQAERHCQLSYLPQST